VLVISKLPIFKQVLELLNDANIQILSWWYVCTRQ